MTKPLARHARREAAILARAATSEYNELKDRAPTLRALVEQS